MAKNNKSNNKQGMIFLFTGDGAGKTTSALGMALRAVGHKQHVIIVQFMKRQHDIGEYRIEGKLSPYYEIHQFGRKELVNLKNPEPVDQEYAQRGLEFAHKCLKKKPDLLILDEINLAIKIGLINFDELQSQIISQLPKGTSLILTGRDASQELIGIANYVSEIKEIKNVPPEKMEPRPGLEY